MPNIGKTLVTTPTAVTLFQKPRMPPRRYLLRVLCVQMLFVPIVDRPCVSLSVKLFVALDLASVLLVRPCVLARAVVHVVETFCKCSTLT